MNENLSDFFLFYSIISKLEDIYEVLMITQTWKRYIQYSIVNLRDCLCTMEETVGCHNNQNNGLRN